MAMKRLTDDERDAVEANLGLVATFVPKRLRDDRFDDAFQDGCLGLIAAVGKCDAARGALSTVAKWWVVDAVVSGEADGSLVRVPRYHRWKDAGRLGAREKYAAAVKAADRPAETFRGCGGETDDPTTFGDEARRRLLAATLAAAAALPGPEGVVVRARLDGRTFGDVGAELGVGGWKASRMWDVGVERLRAALADLDPV